MKLDDGDKRENWARTMEKWKEPCLLKPVLWVMLVIVTITLAGIWPLADFATQLIVVDQIYVQEVANRTIVNIKVLNCKKSTLEECSKCTEIVGKHKIGNSTEQEMSTRKY